MKKFIGILILRLFRWSDIYPEEYKVDKCVMIAAPYTSTWDSVYTFAAFWKRGMDVNFLFDKRRFNRFVIPFIKKMGGIDISDTKKSIVSYSVDLIEKSEKMILIIPPEGSKKRANGWKTGFYHIAKEANVPISLGYLDYDDKTAGVGALFQVSESIDEDFDRLQNFYKNFVPKHPENYNSVIY